MRRHPQITFFVLAYAVACSRLVRWRLRWFWYLVILGLPLAIHLVTAGLHTAAGAEVPSVTAAAVSAAVLTLLVRLVNPTDGPPAPVGSLPDSQRK